MQSAACLRPGLRLGRTIAGQIGRLRDGIRNRHQGDGGMIESDLCPAKAVAVAQPCCLTPQTGGSINLDGHLAGQCGILHRRCGLLKAL